MILEPQQVAHSNQGEEKVGECVGLARGAEDSSDQGLDETD